MFGVILRSIDSILTLPLGGVSHVGKNLRASISTCALLQDLQCPDDKDYSKPSASFQVQHLFHDIHNNSEPQVPDCTSVPPVKEAYGMHLL